MFFKGLIRTVLSILAFIARCKIELQSYHPLSKNPGRAYFVISEN
jgi:hypothetical protein